MNLQFKSTKIVFLLAVNNKEYRVKFSEGIFSKIMYIKEVQRISKKVGRK